MKRILVIDNDKKSSSLIINQINKAGFSYKTISDGTDLNTILLSYKPDLVILELVLPSFNGMDILKSIRQNLDIPVIVVTQKKETFNKILALDLGADDYIVKPFEAEEVLARVKAVLRRYNNIKIENKRVLSFDGLRLDVDSYEAEYNGSLVKLPPKEFELLYYLANNKNKVYKRKELLHEIWGYDYLGDSRTVDVHIKRLRSKIRGGVNWSIDTVWGVGYMFKENKDGIR